MWTQKQHHINSMEEALSSSIYLKSHKIYEKNGTIIIEVNLKFKYRYTHSFMRKSIQRILTDLINTSRPVGIYTVLIIDGKFADII